MFCYDFFSGSTETSAMHHHDELVLRGMGGGYISASLYSLNPIIIGYWPAKTFQLHRYYRHQTNELFLVILYVKRSKVVKNKDYR